MVPSQASSSESMSQQRGMENPEMALVTQILSQEVLSEKGRLSGTYLHSLKSSPNDQAKIGTTMNMTDGITVLVVAPHWYCAGST